MRSSWAPVLPVRLSVGHGPQTTRFECLVDSGAADCLFHADIAAALHLKLEAGIRAPISGIAANVALDAYYHDVNVWIGVDMLRIRAAFTPNLPVAGLLGRRGFFEHFIVTFDPSNVPPGFEIQRLSRA